MLRNAFRYSAISGKVHALYGKTLSMEDFKKLAYMQSVSEIASFLATNSSWKEALDSIPENEIHRGTLEHAISSGLMRDYRKLLSFSFGKDKKILQSYCKDADVAEILNFLRLLGAGHGQDYVCSKPEYFSVYGEIDYNHLMKEPTFSGLLEASKESIFSEAIRRLEPKRNEHLNYTKIETALRKKYFENLHHTVVKNLRKEDTKELLLLINTRVDYANIVNIYRAKNYFQLSAEELIGYILPFQGKLKNKDLKKLLNAKDGEEVLDILKNSAYGKDFSQEFENIEDVYYDKFTKLNKKYLKAPSPGPFTMVAYLNLRELEYKNLSTVIECVRYKIDPQRTLELLIHSS